MIVRYQDKVKPVVPIHNPDKRPTWLDGMNHAISHAEAHLCEPIDYTVIARIAQCSVYHFQRMFACIAGVPFSEYVRRSRMTCAAFDIQQSNVRILDVAISHGYESPESFARAFKMIHGVSPIAARQSSVRLKAYPRMTLHIQIEGDVNMEYRLEQSEAFAVFGVETEVGTEERPTEIAVPAFWQQCRQDGTLDRMHDAIGLHRDTMLHVATYACEGTRHMYMICYACPEEGVPAAYKTLSIQANTWAVFSLDALPLAENATGQIQHLWHRIFTEWFPASEYELADSAEMEKHFANGDGTYRCEIWIPIKPRKHII